MTFGNTLTVDLQATRYGTGWLLALAALALCVSLFALRPAWFWPVGVAIAAYTFHCIWRIRRPRFRRLVVHPGTDVSLIPADENAEPVRGNFTGRPFVSPWIMCFGISTPGGRHDLCLFPDSTGANAFRQLAGRLRGQGA